MRRKWFGILVLVAALAMLPATAAASIQVFSENFEGVVSSQLSGVTTIEGTQGFAAYGFGTKFLRNTTTGNPAQKTILTLTGLAAHDKIDINFLFGAIDSWDSTNGTARPDYFNVTVDGVLVFQPTFAIASGSVNYSNGLLNGPNPTQLGFSSWNDRAYDFGLAPELHNIAHTASSLTIEFFASGAGWQGGSDESWAMDGLEVRINPTGIPLPGTMLLLGSGLMGLGAWRRFRKG
jgi:hypothetical protein